MHFYNLHQREKGGGKFNLSLSKNAIDILTIQLFVKQLETQVLETKKKISQTQDCDWAIKKILKRFAFKRFSAFYLKAWPSSTSLDENLITHIAHLRKDISIWKAVAKSCILQDFVSQKDEIVNVGQKNVKSSLLQSATLLSSIYQTTKSYYLVHGLDTWVEKIMRCVCLGKKGCEKS